MKHRRGEARGKPILDPDASEGRTIPIVKPPADYRTAVSYFSEK